jgi:hypothetical protein
MKNKPAAPEESFTYEEYLDRYKVHRDDDDDSGSDDAEEVGTAMADISLEILRSALKQS